MAKPRGKQQRRRKRKRKQSEVACAHLRVGFDNETEFILGNQLRQYSDTTQASKWGNNTGSHSKDELQPYGKKILVVAD